MSLIITEVSRHGVVMLADTALTVKHGPTIRISLGVKKLQQLPGLSAGISMWGQGTIGSQRVDEWIRDFVAAKRPLSSIDHLSNELWEELKIACGDTSDLIGFHIAGFERTGDKLKPVCHLVTNAGEGPGKNHLLKIPFKRDVHDKYGPYTDDLSFGIVRNGDFQKYATLIKAVEDHALPVVRKMGINLPHPSIIGRLQWQSAWIRFVSALTESATGYKTIGDEVLALAFEPNGRVHNFLQTDIQNAHGLSGEKPT
jgi:hypothetical protein